jgi:hypothetical protein
VNDKVSSVTKGRDIFGVPVVLSGEEVTSLIRDLTVLWKTTYGESPKELEADLQQCRRFFDPLARGHTLRERLSRLQPAPRDLRRSTMLQREPLVVNAGDGVMIVGIEARLLLELLEQEDVSDDHVVLSAAQVAAAERRALGIYRGWSLSRLDQVIALRSGQGREVMQAISVGLVLALLVNRSDTPERAVVRWDHTTPDGRKVDVALHAGAERFAEVISGGRGSRSRGEQRLKGGYAISEARRRLAHRLAVVPDRSSGGELLFVPQEHRGEVISFLGRDLARRSGLSDDTLRVGLDQLVLAFRAAAGSLANRAMVFERPADTRSLKHEILASFQQARSASND